MPLNVPASLVIDRARRGLDERAKAAPQARVANRPSAAPRVCRSAVSAFVDASRSCADDLRLVVMLLAVAEWVALRAVEGAH
jgi:hypothetical protein